MTVFRVQLNGPAELLQGFLELAIRGEEPASEESLDGVAPGRLGRAERLRAGRRRRRDGRGEDREGECGDGGTESHTDTERSKREARKGKPPPLTIRRPQKIAGSCQVSKTSRMTSEISPTVA